LDARTRDGINRLILALRNNATTTEEVLEGLECLLVIDQEGRKELLAYLRGVAAGFGDNINRISNEVASHAEQTAQVRG